MSEKYPSEFWKKMAELGEDPDEVLEYMIQRYEKLCIEDKEKADARTEEDSDHSTRG